MTTSAQGYGIGAAVGATAATVAAAAAPAATAAAAFAISTAIGTAIPIPLLGTAIGAVVGAFTAASIAIAGATADSFHPDAPTARAWLLVFQLCPGFVYSGIDTINVRSDDAARRAARLVRYFRVVSGIVPNPTGILYNPNNSGYKDLPTDSEERNPYVEGPPDPGEPLTDPKVTERVRQTLLAGREPPMMLKTPVEAQAALQLLRSKAFADSGVLGWGEVKDNPKSLPALRFATGQAMTLAGETGSDAYLSNLLQGDVSPKPLAAADPKLGGVGDGAELPAPFFTPERVALGIVFFGGVAALVYPRPKRK